jgi:hypothetical protein
MFKLVRQFTGGLLDGLSHTEVVNFQVKPGTKVLQPIGGSPYIVVSCDPVTDETVACGRRRKSDDS